MKEMKESEREKKDERKMIENKQQQQFNLNLKSHSSSSLFYH